MIKKEFHSTRKDGVKLFRTYSDQYLKIKKVGTDEVYSEAIDIENAGFEYEETEIHIQDDTDIKENEVESND